MTRDEAIQHEIDNGASHYEEFDGKNCNDLDDNYCSGWTVGEHRCDCGNRRMTWGSHQYPDGSWHVWPEAY